MVENKSNRILMISTDSWDDTNSGGNTYSNLFSRFENAEFSHVFCRESMPNNRICRQYFRITDKMLLKYMLSPSKIGKEFCYSFSKKTAAVNKDAKTNNEKKLISLIHKYNFKFAYTAENMLWRMKGWQNKIFDDFLEKQAPNIIFSFAIPTVQRLMLLEYIKEKTGAKVVLMIADHVCHEFFCSNGKKGKASAKRMNKLLKMADKVYAITDELKAAYSKQFGVDISILRKGCTFDTELRQSIGDPVRMVYAGNLLYGRLDILEKLAQNIRQLNRDGEQMILDIYSGTHIDEKDKERIHISGASVFHGACPFEEVKKILAQSDIVLHVESFEQKQMDYVKYSFSTKITDALESGRLFMVIGPSGISSVEYAKKIPGAVVVENVDNIDTALKDILSDKALLWEKMQMIRDFACKNHSSDVVLPAFYSDMLSLLQE